MRKPEFINFFKKIKKSEKQDDSRKVKWFQRIQFKLAGAFLIPVIFIVILGISSYKEASTGIVEGYEESIDKASGITNKYFTLTLDSVQNMYKSYLNDSDYKQYFQGLSFDEPTQIARHLTFTSDLKSVLTTDNSVNDIMFLSDKVPSVVTTGSETEGLYTIYTGTKQGALLKDDNYGYYLFGNVSDADQALGTSSDRYGLRLARHMVGFNGVMLIDINKDVVLDALESMNVGEGTIVAIITTDETELLSDGTNPETPVFVGTDFYEEALDSSEMTGSKYVIYQGSEYLFEYSKIEGRGAIVCALVPKSFLTSKAAGIRNLTIILVAVAIVVAVAIGTILAAGIGRAISTSVKQFGKVASGDLTANVKTKRKDEFALLASGANGMIGNMNGLISDITQLSQDLSNASNSVMDTAGRLLESSGKIQTSIKNIDTGNATLDEGTEKCLEQMDDLSRKIKEVSTSSDEVAQMAKISANVINDGQQSIATMTKSANATSVITANVIHAIEELDEKTATIEGIINVINDIASQTNLLSLNASIEAARAGEAGRGFAVVAEEIRTLADESRQSAMEIGKIISQISENTKDVVKIAKNAKETVDEQESAVASMTDSFALIKEHTEKFIIALESINTNVKNMDMVRKATLNAMESVSAVSTQTASETSSVYRNTGVQTEQIAQLDDEAEKLEKKAAKLSQILSKFKIE